MSSARARPSLITAGLPTASAFAGTTVSFNTTELAPTMAPVHTRARCNTIAPELTCAPFSMMQASRCARCPMTQSSPIRVGHASVVCTTVPSWMLVRAPT